MTSRLHNGHCLAAAVLLAGVAAGAGLAATAGWKATDIGYPSEEAAYVVPVALNDQGIAAANNETVDDPAVDEAFLSDHGTIRLLNVPGSNDVQVRALNDQGVALGIAHMGDLNAGHGVAVVWLPGDDVPQTISDPTGRTPADDVMNDRNQIAFDQPDAAGNLVVSFSTLLPGRGASTSQLPTLGGATAIVTGLNDQGVVIGESATRSGGEHAFSWQHGKITDLGTIGSYTSSAVRINAAGLIVGGLETHSGLPVSAVEWKHGKLVRLGTFGAPRAAAIGVNARGDVLVQTSAKNGRPLGAVLVHANGKTTRIPTPFAPCPMTVTALNNRDQIVGYGGCVYPTRAFIWQNGSETLLLPTANDPGAPNDVPTALNNAGQVLGVDYVPTSQGNASHGVIWEQR